MSDENLFRKIKSAIADDPDKSIRFEDIWNYYDGSHRLLDLFCQRFGSYDPWEAASNAELKSAIFRTRTELSEMQKQYGRKGRSESGHFLTSQLYMYVDKHDPTVTWVSGVQAITKIMETFGTYDQRRALSPEGRREIKEHKRKQARKTSKEFTESLEEVLKDPSLVSDIQSTLDKHKVHYILGLDKALSDRIHKLDSVIYGNTAFVDEKTENYLLAMDPGGQFFSWFERQLDKLPHRIRDIFTTVRDPSVEISDDKRRKYFGALVAYAACHTPVNKEVAIGGYQKDLELLLNLPEEDPVIEKHGKVDLTGIRDILEKKGDITLIEAVKVFDAYPVDDVRQEINSVTYERFSKEVDDAISRLEEHFIEDGRWKGDCLNGSVPKKRLNETRYEQALVHDDWKRVMDYLRVRTLAPEKHFFTALPMEDFRQMIEGIVKSDRKIRQLDRRDRGETDEVFKGSEYELTERFRFRYGISMDEMIERIQAVYPDNSMWKRYGDRVLKERGAGLFKDMRSTERLAEIAHTVVPARDMEMEKARYVLNHPLVRTVYRKVDTSKDFYSSEEARRLEDISSLKEELDNRKYRESLMEKLDAIKRCYVGRIGWKVNINRMAFALSSSSSTRMGDLQIINPEQTERELDRYLKQYARPSDEWYSKLNTLERILGSKGELSEGLVDKGFIQEVEAKYATLNYFDKRSMEELLEGEGSYKLKVTGTTVKDRGRFKNEFPEFGYDRNRQVWSTNIRNPMRRFSRSSLLDVAEKVRKYCERYDAELTIHLI